jgi:hypothetical protein
MFYRVEDGTMDVAGSDDTMDVSMGATALVVSVRKGDTWEGTIIHVLHKGTLCATQKAYWELL